MFDGAPSKGYNKEKSLRMRRKKQTDRGAAMRHTIDERLIRVTPSERQLRVQEMGFYDEEGNLLEEYVIRDVDWIQKMMDEAGKEGT